MIQVVSLRYRLSIRQIKFNMQVLIDSVSSMVI